MTAERRPFAPAKGARRPSAYGPLPEELEIPLLSGPHTPPHVLLAGAPMAGAGGEGATVVVVVLEGGDELAAVAGSGAGADGVAAVLVVVFVAAAGVSTCDGGRWAASDGPASAKAPITAPAMTTGSPRAAPIRAPRLPTMAILGPLVRLRTAWHRLTPSVTTIVTASYTSPRQTFFVMPSLISASAWCGGRRP